MSKQSSVKIMSCSFANKGAFYFCSLSKLFWYSGASIENIEEKQRQKGAFRVNFFIGVSFGD
jgi:hypothetical protein